MNLLKRKNGFYYIQYFDIEENRIRRISTSEKIKKNAIKFLSEFRSNLKSRSLVKFISLKNSRRNI